MDKFRYNFSDKQEKVCFFKMFDIYLYCQKRTTMEFKLSREVSPTGSGGSFHFRSHDEIPKGAMFSIPEKYTSAGVSTNFEVIGALPLQDNVGNLYQAVPKGNLGRPIEITFPIEKGKIFRTL